MIVGRVPVGPVLGRGSDRIRSYGGHAGIDPVDVPLGRIVHGLTVIGLGRIEVLDQVVPHVELPDDLFGPVDLDGVIRPYPPADGGGIAARSDALLVGLVLPAEDEHIAGGPGARGDRMVLNMGRVIELVLPDHVPVPVELLDQPAVPAADVYLGAAGRAGRAAVRPCLLLISSRSDFVPVCRAAPAASTASARTRRLPFGSNNSCRETT